MTAGSNLGASDLWTPEQSVVLPHVQAAAAPAVVSPGSGYEDHKPRTPPPDLPSLLLDSRITYLGMPVRRRSPVFWVVYPVFWVVYPACYHIFVALQLVPAVTELIIAELLYLQYKDRTKPIYLYINSTGTSRADGETVSSALIR